MWKKKLALVAAVGGAVTLLSLPVFSSAAKEKPAPKMINDGRAKCYECHGEVKALKEGSKHAKLACGSCHGKLKEHLADYEKVKPTTDLELSLCGKCHKEQYASFYQVNYENPWKKEKSAPNGRSPMQEKLLAQHGFNKEHNEPRGHAFMVIDQFEVDRFAGGRFQFKKGIWGMDATGKVWDVLTDTGKDLPESAKAGNPTCIQCKTSDQILKWKFMGDKDPRAKWDRTSNVIDVAKDTQNPVGCIHCHDPHGAQPRVVRDGLIQAIDQEGAKTFEKNAKTDLKVVSFRDGFRKIGVMEKTDSRMMCAQCHVEYNCNPGTQWSDGEKVAFGDRRTNHFPLKGPKDILAHYKKLNFFDYKHEVTGARLIKLQHPEAEAYAGSVHDRNGIQCHDCHMPKVKGKGGKTFTTHGVVKPIDHVQEACLRCHKKSTVAQKKWMIESVRNYTKGKMRKAEYWLGKLIDTYAMAKKNGVDESVLAEARAKHEEAHVLWEFWTAENSDGWHNPELARDTLAASITASKAGIAALTKAMEPKPVEIKPAEPKK